MTKNQEKELNKHHAKINDRGESLVTGSIIWLITEALENIYRIEEEVGPKVDRPSKKKIKTILKDLRDQLRDLKHRID